MDDLQNALTPTRLFLAYSGEYNQGLIPPQWDKQEFPMGSYIQSPKKLADNDIDINGLEVVVYQ